MACHPTLPLRTWHPSDCRWAPSSEDVYYVPDSDEAGTVVRDWVHGLDDGELLPVRGRDAVGDGRPSGAGALARVPCCQSHAFGPCAYP